MAAACAAAAPGTTGTTETRWRLVVGNDVVDLRDAEARGKSRNQRFLERVLCPAELRRLGAEPGDAALWHLWAAKEAAYKVIFKVFGASPPARALCVVEERRDRHGEALADVEWRGRRVPIRSENDAERVHCVAWWPEEPWPDVSGSIRAEVDRVDATRWCGVTLTPREAQTARNPGSAAVRALAKDLLARAGGASIRPPRPSLEIVRAAGPRGLGPPRFLADGRPLRRWDVSLSHHGRFVAAAVTSCDDSGASLRPAEH